MEITTKFDIGDEIFFLEENRIMKGKISRVQICKNLKISNEYYDISYSDDRSNNRQIELSEGNIYKSIDDLIDDLLEDYGKRY